MLGCMAVLLGYAAVLWLNVPPATKSNHVSVHGNLLYLASLGVVIATIALAIAILLRMKNRVGKRWAILMGLEAMALGVMSVSFLRESLRFFGVM